MAIVFISAVSMFGPTSTGKVIRSTLRALLAVVRHKYPDTHLIKPLLSLLARAATPKTPTYAVRHDHIRISQVYQR